jgi:hypothetical protein
MKKSTKPTQKEQIRQAIDRLHERSSGDFQTLLRQVKKRQRKIQLNIPQAVAAVAPQKQLYLEWGRGTGKTTFRGYRWSQRLRQMPRSTGLFVGPSYQFILTRILPSLQQGLEMFGLYEGLHYFIGREAPRSWRNEWGKAFQPPKKYDRYISFYNGMGVHMISQDVPGDGRGLNSDWIDGDEAGLLSPDKLQENTNPTLRGTNVNALKDAPLFGSKDYTSSTPLTPEGVWFTNAEQVSRENPHQVAFISATCEYNMHNLRKGYLKEAKQDAYADWVYRAEYLNIRPSFTSNAFYSLLSEEQHAYTNYDYNFYRLPGQKPDCRGDADLVAGLPLILGVDWGAAINCLSVGQYLASSNEHRILKDMHVLGDDQKIQDDLFDDLANYYQHHDCKRIELWYDPTGNIATGHTRRTRAEQARRTLESHGFSVTLMTTSRTNPEHASKHFIWERLLREDQLHLPRIRINKANCPNLWISMRNTRTKTGRNGEVKKDKSSEKKKSILRQHATDLSDANDAAVVGRYGHLMQYSGGLLPDDSV